jgi:hypothetical protein
MLAPHKKMLKLMLMLKEMRCEGVEFIALERIFVRTFNPSETSHISWHETSFSVNILHDIGICFI